MTINQPAAYSYFFGPGYTQLMGTIEDAWEGNHRSEDDVSLKIEAIRKYFDKKWTLFKWPVLVFAYLFRLIAFIVLYVFGSAFTIIMFLIHGGITFLVMCAVYILFSFTWLVDRIYLLVHSIRSSCPQCKERSLIPVFECDHCNVKHTKLVPGVYGVWKRRCQCGNKIPTNVLGGRSRLRSFCPSCESPLSASDARQLGIQIIGGVSSGKTVLLSAFYNAFDKRCKSIPGLKVSMNDDNRAKFSNLIRWYQGEPCPGTTDFNASMYSLLLDSQQLNPRRQISVYDIAGEMFRHGSEDSVVAQAQYKYTNGIVVVIDPLSSSLLREKVRESSPDDIKNHSSDDAGTVINNFINYMLDIGGMKPGDRFRIPVSVVIAKADIAYVRDAIHPSLIGQRMIRFPGQYKDEQEAGDDICREFMCSIGMGSVVDALEVSFSDIHYYAASAMGHVARAGEAYKSWGVEEPFYRIIRQADPKVAEILRVVPNKVQGK